MWSRDFLSAPHLSRWWIAWGLGGICIDPPRSLYASSMWVCDQISDPKILLLWQFKLYFINWKFVVWLIVVSRRWLPLCFSFERMKQFENQVHHLDWFEYLQCFVQYFWFFHIAVRLQKPLACTPWVNLGDHLSLLEKEWEANHTCGVPFSRL